MTEREIKELLKFIKREIGYVKTSFPCEVIEVNGTRVSVKLSVDDSSEITFPTILDVPVMAQKAGKALIYLPVSVGDKGVVFFSTKPIRKWKTGQGKDWKIDFDLDNAFYFGGVFTDYDDQTKAKPNSLTINMNGDIIELDGSDITIKPASGDTKINDATDNAVLFSQLDTILQQFSTDINTEINKRVLISGQTPIPIVIDLTPAKDTDLKI